jgi:hypothetical protein
VIAMTMDCQLESLLLNAGVLITPPQVARRMSNQSRIHFVTQLGSGHFCFDLPATSCRMDLVFST